MRLAEQADHRALPEQLDIPEELARRQHRLAAIRRARHEIEARARHGQEHEQAAYEAKLADRQARERKPGKKPGGRPPEPPVSGTRTHPGAAGGSGSRAGQGGEPVGGCGILQRQQCEGESEGTDHPVSIHASGTSPYPAGGTTDADPPATDDPVTQMRYRLGTEAGRALYAKRKSTIEPTFGIIKHVLGFRQFLLRGLDQVEGEWDLVCIGFDLKRRFELTA